MTFSPRLDGERESGGLLPQGAGFREEFQTSSPSSKTALGERETGLRESGPGPRGSPLGRQGEGIDHKLCQWQGPDWNHRAGPEDPGPFLVLLSLSCPHNHIRCYPPSLLHVSARSFTLTFCSQSRVTSFFPQNPLRLSPDISVQDSDRSCALKQNK